MIIILMGVSGSGKSTVGQALATVLGWNFCDADQFHSAAAKEKMSQGIPLNDQDRSPWLESLQSAIDEWLREEKNRVLACSALKSSYRQTLRCDDARVKLIYLQGSFETISERLKNRKNHFMKEDLLQNQFDTLEEPNEEAAINVDVSQSPAAIVQEIKKRLEL
ncbi:gluconokinase, GntK/IdnK-type [Lyngbya aestuarii]|uniref:gluconokinase, GntK/IdnK-type n=1 Tax=Lyngbya aestuarii TaxID=118322 RepID=UPI00403E1998